MRRIGIFLGLFFLCVVFAIVFYRFSFQHLLFASNRRDLGVYFILFLVLFYCCCIADRFEFQTNCFGKSLNPFRSCS